MLGRDCPALIRRQTPPVAGQGPERLITCALQPTNVTLEEAEDYQPFVEQAGNQANFPNTTGTNPFALTGTVVRYLAIGGAPLSPLSTNTTCKAYSGTAHVKAIVILSTLRPRQSKVFDTPRSTAAWAALFLTTRSKIPGMLIVAAPRRLWAHDIRGQCGRPAVPGVRLWRRQ